MSKIQTESKVPEALSGQRLDQVAARLFPEYSRARIQAWIKSGELTVDGYEQKLRFKPVGGELLRVDAELVSIDEWKAEHIPFDIIYEDEHLLVVNKQAGLVVHPASGNLTGTLGNALLGFDARQGQLPRAGIVHRLDKDTSGLLVVAKSLVAHTSLVEQLQSRSMGREYQAVVQGVLTSGGTIDQPIGRHPRNRKKMAVVAGGKNAITHYYVKTRFRAHTHLRVKLETGRTHQIRVHMAEQNHGIVGDPVYGNRKSSAGYQDAKITQFLAKFKRQALHAWRLQLEHPTTGKSMHWAVDPPEDMQQLLALLSGNSEDD